MFVGEPVRGDGVKVFKVVEGSCLCFVAVSDAVVWVRQHWMRRAVLCSCDDACPGCEWNNARTVGFLAVEDDRGRRGLLEVSPPALDRLFGLQRMQEDASPTTLLGLRFNASRLRRRTPLVLEPLEFVDEVAEATVLRVARAVACLFRLPRVQDGEEVRTYFERVKCVLHERAAEAVAGERALARMSSSRRGS